MVQAIGGTLPPRIDAAPVATPAPSGGGVADLAAASPSTPSEATPPPSPTRVVVEPGRDKFVLVFKVLDNATGNILAEIPHQTPQQAAENPNYASGALINQKV